jgi:hypothetical protein
MATNQEMHMKTTTMNKQQLAAEVERLNKALEAQRAGTSEQADLINNMVEEFNSRDFGKIAIKTVLAFAYGWTLGICAGSAIDAMLMLSIPAFGQLAIAIAIVALAVATAYVTSGFVTESVYNGGAVACDYVGRGYNKLATSVRDLRELGVREWFNSSRTPPAGYVHTCGDC